MAPAWMEVLAGWARQTNCGFYPMKCMTCTCIKAATHICSFARNALELSFSSLGMAGNRCGFVIGPENIIDSLKITRIRFIALRPPLKWLHMPL